MSADQGPYREPSARRPDEYVVPLPRQRTASSGRWLGAISAVAGLLSIPACIAIRNADVHTNIQAVGNLWAGLGLTALVGGAAAVFVSRSSPGARWITIAFGLVAWGGVLAGIAWSRATF